MTTDTPSTEPGDGDFALRVVVPLNDAEQKALAELAQMFELSPQRVMIGALRQYQLVAKGGAKLVFPPSELKATFIEPLSSSASMAGEEEGGGLVADELLEFAEWAGQKSNKYRDEGMQHLVDYSQGQYSGYHHASAIVKPVEARWQADRAALEKRIAELERDGVPGTMHEVDKALYDHTVLQRNQAWQREELLKADRARWQAQAEQLLALSGTPWPLRDVLNRLAEFAQEQLGSGYDGHGWEELDAAMHAAFDHAILFDAILSTAAAGDVRGGGGEATGA